MSNLKGKKLLILGSTAKTIDLVNFAKEMGVYTIVADWNPVEKAPVKLAADEHWEISLLDYDDMSKKIQEEGVNGIITGFTDSYLLPYQHLCEINGLPSYASKEVFETTLDKSKFKELCKNNSVPTVPEFSIDNFDPSSICESNKIFIKPVDNSGSRGIIKCVSPETFNDCLQYALSYSKKKQVVIEKFMEYDTFSTSYTIQDGVISTSTMNDRIVRLTSNGGAATAGGIYPSKYIDLYLKTVDSKVRMMFQNLGVKNGVLFIQGFCDGTNFYFYEMGYRVSGGRHYIYTENQNNTSAAKNLIHFALTGSMADYKIADRDNPKFHNLCCQLNIMGIEAVIDKVEGFDYIKSLPEVIEATLLKKEGDKIGADGTTAQQVAGIYTVVNDYDHFYKVCSEIERYFKLLDKDGNNLVIAIDRSINR